MLYFIKNTISHHINIRHRMLPMHTQCCF